MKQVILLVLTELLLLLAICYGQNTEFNTRACTYSFVVPQTDVLSSCQSYSKLQVDSLKREVDLLKRQIKEISQSNFTTVAHHNYFNPMSIFATCSNKNTTFDVQHKDCQDVKDFTPGSYSGVYPIYPVTTIGPVISMQFKNIEIETLETSNEYTKFIAANTSGPIFVYCDLKDDLVAWTIIMRRVKMDVSFNRTFEEYKNGFGDSSEGEDFWLGLEAMHTITKQAPSNFTLWIELKDSNRIPHVVVYQSFFVGDEKGQYTISAQKFQGASVKNNLGNARPFVAREGPDTPVENKGSYSRTVEPETCLVNGIRTNGGGWWFQSLPYSYYRNRDCGNSNLNAPEPYWFGIDKIVFVEMKLRKGF